MNPDINQKVGEAAQRRAQKGDSEGATDVVLEGADLGIEITSEVVGAAAEEGEVVADAAEIAADGLGALDVPAQSADIVSEAAQAGSGLVEGAAEVGGSVVEGAAEVGGAVVEGAAEIIGGLLEGLG